MGGSPAAGSRPKKRMPANSRFGCMHSPESPSIVAGCVTSLFPLGLRTGGGGALAMRSSGCGNSRCPYGRSWYILGARLVDQPLC